MNNETIDPITFEVMSHRLRAINEEQGITASRISGSPIIYEAFDFNTSIMTKEGDVLFSGFYVLFHSTGLDVAVRSVMEIFGDDIHDGDMFVSNDPWKGAAHTSDFWVITPIFWEGELLCWSGVAMHDADVGGPVPGGFAIGARTVFEEPPIIPPVKLFVEGKYQKSIEDLLLRNVRLPELNKLNLRARVASQEVARKRIIELVDRYGKEAYLATQEKIISDVEESLRKRLLQLPDGTWCHHGYVDHDGVKNELYEIRLALTKKGDQLIFDFRGTSPQAEGIINCTRTGLEAGIKAAVLPMFCYDIHWCPAGLNNLIEIITEPGTVNNANFPAATSSASIGSSWMTCNVSTGALAKMFASSEDFMKEVQAGWYPGWNGLTFSGLDQEGNMVAEVSMDAVGGGGGALSYRDGLDVGGTILCPRMALPNVETNEKRFPVLEIFRKMSTDTGGPGKYRGGVGMEALMVPHKNQGPLTDIVFTHGVSQPEARGIYGGYPSTTQGHRILKKTNIFEIFSGNIMPTSLSEIVSEKDEWMAAKSMDQIDGSDLHYSRTSGGGGYGDPIERDPYLVWEDTVNGYCSVQEAERVYGLVLTEDGRAIDLPKTEERRKQMVQQRLERFQSPSEWLAAYGIDRASQ
jgi:N-methylhydantoinase B